jgi:GNAT superfamily N-acetyltransferase
MAALHTSHETAQRLEEADILHITRQIEACTQIFPDHISFAETIGNGNGVAALSLPSFGTKLNRITGYGMVGPVSDPELTTIEELFTKNGVDTNITLCPLADSSTLQVLASRGYSVTHFLNSYVRVLTDEDLKEVEVKGITISRVSSERSQDFPNWLVAGFRDGGKAELLLETLGRTAVLRSDTTLYIATDAATGKVAGSACMALLETRKGGVAHLYLDSTLPEYRGRGIQAALLRARLADARKAGFDLASVGARPGNGGSCKNIERAGFSLAYTKIWFTNSSH